MSDGCSINRGYRQTAASWPISVGGGDDATFVYDFARGRLSRATSGTNHIAPTWMPDGRRVTTLKSASRELVSNYVDRGGPEEILYREPGGMRAPAPASWSPDGRVLLFTRNNDIWTLTLPELRAEPLLQSRFVEAAPAVSPDGQWLA